MKILVTGRDGQVARCLAERNREDELVLLSRAELDLSDSDSIERAVAAVAPDVIVNAAAYTAVDRAENEPAQALMANATGPGTLARAAARIGAPVIHLSTDYVFDGTSDRAYREDDPVAPIGTYGRTKLDGECAVAASGAAYVILRTAWVYSPFGNNFVKTMLRLAADRSEVSVVADQIGNPTSAFDLADGILAVVSAWRGSPDLGCNRIYHLSGSGSTSWAGLARTVFDLSAHHGGPSAIVREISTADYPTFAQRPQNSRLDCTRLAQTFGYRAPAWTSSLEHIVARLVSAEHKNRDDQRAVIRLP